MTQKFNVIRVRSQTELQSIAALFTSYAASLPIDLTFQSFSQELESLPDKYAPPTGELFLAIDPHSSAPIGCVAVRPLPLPDVPRCCEMKRLYVTPEGRGLGLGRALATEALGTAVGLGYEHVRLDTLPTMVTARTLYESLGFVECEKYYDTPIEGTVFLAKDLTSR
jgi:ribosomal protein S18 acetylase RimI-like enzyme